MLPTEQHAWVKTNKVHCWFTADTAYGDSVGWSVLESFHRTKRLGNGAIKKPVSDEEDERLA